MSTQSSIATRRLRAAAVVDVALFGALGRGFSAPIGQTNAAAAEENTATMVELAKLSKQTRDEIERFTFT